MLCVPVECRGRPAARQEAVTTGPVRDPSPVDLPLCSEVGLVNRTGHQDVRVVASVFAILAAAAVCATPAAAQVTRLFPADEAASQPDFFSFRARLIQTVLQRDTAGLYAVLAPNVLNSFGGDGGVPEFRSMWRPGDPDSEIWRTLAEILSLGGTFHGDTLFSAPYTFSRFPAGWDAFDHVVVTGSNVRVRSEPDVNSEVLAILSFDIVPLARDIPPGEGASGWEAIRLVDGRYGFIDSRYVRSPTGYRLGIVRRGGRWLIRSLVAGD
jgi:hypothetical protein